MTRNDDFIGQLEGYLDEYEGSTPLPGEVRDAIRAQLPSIQQRPAWWPERRFPSMNNYLRMGVAAAVLAIAAALGYSYLIAPNVGGPGLDEPAPTPTPTVAPLPPATSFDTQPAGEPLEPGSYFTGVAGNRITFTVPAGWQRNIVPRVVWTGNSEVRLGFGEVENIYADPCQPDLGVLDPPPGPTADDLASALAAIPGVTATTAAAEISGFSARYVELDVPEAFGDCIADGGEALLSADGPLEPAIHRFWVVDVDGDRIVIVSVTRAGALSRQVDDLDAMVDSIQINTP
jgi:hypothetical protein